MSAHSGIFVVEKKTKRSDFIVRMETKLKRLLPINSDMCEIRFMRIDCYTNNNSIRAHTLCSLRVHRMNVVYAIRYMACGRSVFICRRYNSLA